MTIKRLASAWQSQPQCAVTGIYKSFARKHNNGLVLRGRACAVGAAGPARVAGVVYLCACVCSARRGQQPALLGL